jgi:hypothetical protein
MPGIDRTAHGHEFAACFLLESCPRNNMNFAGSQLAVFQGTNEDPYLDDTGRESPAAAARRRDRKTANWLRPGGLR